MDSDSVLVTAAIANESGVNSPVFEELLQEFRELVQQHCLGSAGYRPVQADIQITLRKAKFSNARSSNAGPGTLE
jgi:hypothetical protein